MATLPMKAVRKASAVAAVHASVPKVAPVTGIDSPRAMMMNRPQRSAMWPPAMSQSAVVERPRRGSRSS